MEQLAVQLYTLSANLSIQQPNEALTETMHYELFPESVFLRCPVVYALNKEVRRVMHLSVAC